MFYLYETAHIKAVSGMMFAENKEALPSDIFAPTEEV